MRRNDLGAGGWEKKTQSVEQIILNSRENLRLEASVTSPTVVYELAGSAVIKLQLCSHYFELIERANIMEI